MKVIRKAGATSNIFQIGIRDSSSTTGAMLTGLTNASSGLTAYYHRDTDTTATAITLVTMTVGTFTSSGFKEIDATNMPGWYQFCPPDAAIASGAKSCAFHLKGATNMAPLPVEVQLVSYDPDDTVRLGLTAMPNVASGSAGAIPTTGTGSNQISVSSGAVIIQNGTGTGQLSLSSGAVIVQNGTGTGQLSLSSGQVLVQSGTGTGQISLSSGAVIVQNGTGTGQLSLSSGQVLVQSGTGTGQISLSSGTVTVGTNNDKTGYTVSTNNDKTGYSLSSSQTFNVTGNVTGNVSGSVGSVTNPVSISTGQIFMKKNTGGTTITFPMTDSTTHAPLAGLTVTSQRSIDGGALAATTNSVAGISGGLYSLALSAADLNGTMITFVFTAASADTKYLGVVTQP